MSQDAPRRGRGGGQRTPLQKLLYWGMVAGVWGGIFLVTILFGAFATVIAVGMLVTSLFLGE